MTFEQFQATRKWSDDLSEAVGYAADEPQAGYIYEGDLHIFTMGDVAPGQYLLVIGNHERVSDDLTSLERDLYEFGAAEGIIQ